MIIQPNKFDLGAYLAAPRNDIKAHSPIAYSNQVVDMFYGDKKDAGATLPWAKTHSIIKFREKEVSIWGGYNGHGKSQLTTLVGLDFAYQGRIVAIASFEMAPEQTLYRMVRQAARHASPPIPFIKAFLAWCQNRILILDKRGMIEPDYVVAAMRYLRDKHKCDDIFIDNLAKVVRGEDDFTGQKVFVDQVCSTALETGLHAHIIHHLKKGLNETDLPDKMSFKGSGAIVDQVDNALIVHRNKIKERNGQLKSPDPKLLAQHDVWLRIVKQRNGTGREADVGLWYDHAAMSYAEDGTNPAKRYEIAQDLSSFI